jgi:hypothetical protein
MYNIYRVNVKGGFVKDGISPHYIHVDPDEDTAIYTNTLCDIHPEFCRKINEITEYIIRSANWVNESALYTLADNIDARVADTVIKIDRIIGIHGIGSDDDIWDKPEDDWDYVSVIMGSDFLKEPHDSSGRLIRNIIKRVILAIMPGVPNPIFATIVGDYMVQRKKLPLLNDMFNCLAAENTRQQKEASKHGLRKPPKPGRKPSHQKSPQKPKTPSKDDVLEAILTELKEMKFILLRLPVFSSPNQYVVTTPGFTEPGIGQAPTVRDPITEPFHITCGDNTAS